MNTWLYQLFNISSKKNSILNYKNSCASFMLCLFERSYFLIFKSYSELRGIQFPIGQVSLC